MLIPYGHSKMPKKTSLHTVAICIYIYGVVSEISRTVTVVTASVKEDERAVMPGLSGTDQL
jgi:hypothetical protein